MKYRVRWLPSAEDELTRIWLGSSDRSSVTLASRDIDVRLAASASTEGESRPDGRRIIFAQPLGAIYEVNDDAMEVLVIHIWQYRF